MTFFVTFGSELPLLGRDRLIQKGYVYEKISMVKFIGGSGSGVCWV